MARETLKVACNHDRAATETFAIPLSASPPCAGTTLTKSWRNPDYKGQSLKKVLVVGVSDEPDLRRTFEKEFVKELEAAGLDAIPSYTVLPENGQADPAQLSHAVKEAGSDGALINVLVPAPVLRRTLERHFRSDRGRSQPVLGAAPRDLPAGP